MIKRDYAALFRRFGVSVEVNSAYEVEILSFVRNIQCDKGLKYINVAL